MEDNWFHLNTSAYQINVSTDFGISVSNPTYALSAPNVIYLILSLNIDDSQYCKLVIANDEFSNYGENWLLSLRTWPKQGLKLLQIGRKTYK